MKIIKSILLMIICLTTVQGALDEPDHYKTTVAEFVKNYNSGDYKAIFNNFETQMKRVLPLEEARHFFGNRIKSRAGKIENHKFIRYDGTSALYKLKFERAVRGMFITIDSQTRIVGFQIKIVNFDEASIQQSNKTLIALPFRGEWFVHQGGDTENLNHHLIVEWQKGAIDFIVVDKNNRPFKGNGLKNSDYYCFGKKIVSSCDGEVVLAVDGIKDNDPGTINPAFLLGNTVILKTEKGEFLYFCHFKQYSVNVKQGQKVKAGDLLGLCGNSGRSTMPHLHFHIQSRESVTESKGIKCYFNKIKVNGKVKTDYSPIKGDKVKN